MGEGAKEYSPDSRHWNLVVFSISLTKIQSKKNKPFFNDNTTKRFFLILRGGMHERNLVEKISFPDKATGFPYMLHGNNTSFIKI